MGNLDLIDIFDLKKKMKFIFSLSTVPKSVIWLFENSILTKRPVAFDKKYRKKNMADVFTELVPRHILMGI